MKITSVKIELIKKEVAVGSRITIGVDKVTYVSFDNGNKVSLGSLYSFLGNSGADTWGNIEKAKKSGSEKNIIAYLTPFVPAMAKGLQL